MKLRCQLNDTKMIQPNTNSTVQNTASLWNIPQCKIKNNNCPKRTDAGVVLYHFMTSVWCCTKQLATPWDTPHRRWQQSTVVSPTNQRGATGGLAGISWCCWRHATHAAPRRGGGSRHWWGPPASHAAAVATVPATCWQQSPLPR